MLTDAQKRFVELERKKAEVKKFFQELDLATKAVAEEVGLNGFFQDPSDGTVYQIVKPEGKFIPYKEVDFIRTRRGYLGEAKADLSMKKAEEAGFALSDNQKVVVKSEE
jgi:hypothetical protein